MYDEILIGYKVDPVALLNNALFDVQQRLAKSKLDALPVTDGNHFLGLITSRDINELYRLASSQPGLIVTKAE